MRKSVLLLSIFFLQFSCNQPTDINQQNLISLNGNVFSGGTFRVNEIRYYRSLFPLSVTESTSHRVLQPAYEGLVKLNASDLSIAPALAERWERNADATQWTFYLRRGVKFHNNSCFSNSAGREFNAHDVKYCFDKLCTPSELNKQFEITFKNRVEGAIEHFSATANGQLSDGVAGIKVLDNYKIQINLLHPFAGFLNILITPGCFIYPREAFEKYGSELKNKCVGTGPFMLDTLIENKLVCFKKNPNYWKKDEFGNQLPYIDKLLFSFITDKDKEMQAFRNDSLDMVFQVTAKVTQSLLDEIEKFQKNEPPFVLQVTPAMATFYYGFQNESKAFKDKRVRQAFNYAIDREYIVNSILNGDGIPANYGIVPPSLRNYDVKALKGYTLDVEAAKKLLAEAGYANGKGFPKIKILLNTGGNPRNVEIAEAIIKMLKDNLNIELGIDMIPYKEYLEAMENGTANLWKTGWFADYPDPESFLNLLYSQNAAQNPNEKSYLNYMRFKSKEFDEYFLAAMQESDSKRRMDRYLQADQVAIDEAAVMPIFYDENYRLVKPNIKNLFANGMEYRDFSQVYFVPKNKVSN
jgi:oligopeptide transport system substrate-binding protein